jgi:hypothetical protein
VIERSVLLHDDDHVLDLVNAGRAASALAPPMLKDAPNSITAAQAPKRAASFRFIATRSKA